MKRLAFQTLSYIVVAFLAIACYNNDTESQPELEDYFYLERKNQGYAIHLDPDCAENSTYLNSFRVYEGQYDFFCSKCISKSNLNEIQRRVRQNKKEDAILRDAYRSFKNLVDYDESYVFFKEEVLRGDNLKWFYEFMQHNGHEIYEGTYEELFIEIEFDRNYMNPEFAHDVLLNKPFKERYDQLK